MAFSAEAYAFLALVVSVVGLLVAFAGVRFNAAQSRHAANATAIAIIQHFMIQCRELWDECDAATADAEANPEKFRRRVGDILGHFEVVITLIAEGVVEGKPRRLVEGTVRDYLSHMVARGFGPYVTSLLDDDEVCENLRDFCLQCGPRLRHRDLVFEMMKLPNSSL